MRVEPSVSVKAQHLEQLNICKHFEENLHYGLTVTIIY